MAENTNPPDRDNGPSLSESPMIEPIEIERIKNEFCQLLKTYYQDFLYHRGNIDWSAPDTHERYNTLRLRLKELSEQLPETEMNSLVDEITTEILSLPNSLTLSPKAWEMVQSVRAKCEPHYQEGEDVFDDKSLKKEIQEKFPTFYFIFPGTHLLLYREGDKLVGVSAYDVEEDKAGQPYMYVAGQEAIANQPGIGLSMLQELIQQATDRSLQYVILTTTRTPLGLGNLGFTYVPAHGSYGAASYRLELAQKVE